MLSSVAILASVVPEYLGVASVDSADLVLLSIFTLAVALLTCMEVAAVNLSDTLSPLMTALVSTVLV